MYHGVGTGRSEKFLTAALLYYASKAEQAYSLVVCMYTNLELTDKKREPYSLLILTQFPIIRDRESLNAFTV